MNLFQLKYFRYRIKIKVHILQKKKNKVLHVTAAEGRAPHLLTGCSQHHCSLNAVHYRLCNFGAAGSSCKEPNFLRAPLK